MRIEVDRREIDRLLRQWPDQARFATSLAINNTLKRAQSDQRAHMQSAFEVRNARWMNQAVKIKPFASRSSLFGVIQIDPPGDNDDMLIRHEKGGTKRAIFGHIAVPGRGVKRGASGPKPRPRTVMRGQGGFVGSTRAGDARAIFQRVGSGKRTRVRYLYTLVKRAKIAPRLKFVDTVTASLQRNAGPELLSAWRKAIAGAR